MKEKLKKILESINEKLDNYFSPKGKKIFIGLVTAALAALLFLIFTGGKKEEIVTVEEEQPLEEVTEMVEIENIEPKEENLVSLTVDDFGRADPFLPSSESFSNTDGYELLAPPETIMTESDAAKVVSTKVSGIMYDSRNPSAILNIEGSDYLVRSGDYINNYKVLSIGRNLVTVQLGSNIYKAGVGEAISSGEVNYNNVYNLENKFGGARR